MGLMDRVKGQFIDIVEFLDTSRDTIVWRFPRQGNEIKLGAKLVVREGQTAVFENEGTIADVFTPGTYTLETKNLPILSDLKGWKYGFNSPFKAEVYFVATRQFTDFKWGTQNPITLRDAEFGMVRLRAFGTYSLQVEDAAKLLRQLVGTDPQFRTDEVGEFLRQTIVGKLAPAIAAAKIPVLDLAANQETIAAGLATTLTESLAEFGLRVPRFVIENVSLPPDVEAALDKRTSMGVLGDLNQYTKFQAANAIEDAAQNPNGGNSGLGLGVGVALGQQVGSVLSPAAAAPAPAAPSGPPPLPTAAPLYLGIDGQQVGPVAIADLPARIASGELTRDTLVWRQGMAGWVAASTVPEVASLFAAVPPPLPPQTPQAPPAPPASPAPEPPQA
ncbi:MAG: SPFH domain-containing protein [Jatrophihabitans sp.]|uniref:SPFH domain-containing protein n=1 Tax=Jatrophihabitans sp. TaxID=1932789 RepID=UPI003F821FAA